MGLKYLAEQETPPVSLDALTPDQQEVMCSEFLRHPCVDQFQMPRLGVLLMPVGRTMKDVDIYGLAVDGREIFAQVTYHTQRRAALKQSILDAYRAKDRYTIMFCRASEVQRDGLAWVMPIEQVFESFKGVPEGASWLGRAFKGLSSAVSDRSPIRRQLAKKHPNH